MRGLFTGEIARDLLTVSKKISQKLSRWDKNSHQNVEKKTRGP